MAVYMPQFIIFENWAKKKQSGGIFIPVYI